LKTRCLFILIIIILLDSCSSTKNTGGTRWYHSFNTRYNVYFNGSQAFDQAFKAQQEGYAENYSEMIMMYPVSSLPKEKDKSGGSFDKAIEKAVKAIKMHSVQTKPERKQGKQNNPGYREFLNRKEYNPFLHNAWMLMAKSQFYNGDFLEAASSFSYISRLYESQPEIANTAKLYKARCYDELGWFYDADNILSKLPANQLTKEQKKLYSSFYADHLIKQKQYAEAIPYLKASIKSGGDNKFQRTREKYLLGQLYTATGQKELAYKSFGEVSSANAPYILELSAKIRQTEVYPGGDVNKMSKKLNRMTKSSKNADYLDQIYYAMGNVYMSVPDTANAIKSYELGVEKSTRNGIEKTLNQIKLGDIYFDQQKYLNAQPNYSDALGQLKKDDDAYPRVSKRSEVLDALVVHVQAVELQDSLQRLSRMTDDERMVVINKIIADLIKKEKEDQKKSQQEQYQANQNALQEQMQANRPTTPTVPNAVTPPGGSNDFYFYNQQVVAIGKNAFQQKWGRRNLEDDWRRRNKSNPVSFDSNDNFASTDTIPNDTIQNNNADATAQSSEEKPATSTDTHDPQFYLQQIPVTPDELAASDLIIINGLFNMGVIYKDMLEDNNLSLETFQTLDTRFPDNENRETAYYYMYLIYWQKGNMEMANLYKAKIREAFPQSDLAIAMADPDYEYNQKRMNVVQDSLYQQTYADYLAGNSMDVRKNYQWISTKYNQSKLMPKFMLLNALSFAQTNEPDTFKVLLKGLIDKYPKEDVSDLASDMMKGFQRGLLLSSSGDKMLAQGSLFNIHFNDSGEAIASDSTVQFSAETAAPYVLLLIYPKGSVDENLLLYTIAEYNFGNFMISDFGLEKSTVGEVGMLQITGFNNHDEVMQYLNKIQQPDGYAQKLGQSVLITPISESNYKILMKGKSMDEYMTFFEKNFTQGNENLIAQWRLKQAEEKKVSPESEGSNLLTSAGDKTNEETPLPETVLPVDTTTQITLPVDTVQVAAVDSLSTKGVTSDEVVESVNKVYNEASDKLNNVSNTLNEIASDPVRGIANLFKRRKTNNAIEEFAKQQEKEEKEQQAQLKKEQDEKNKAAQALAAQQEKEKNESLKKKAEEDKAALKAKQQEQIDLAKKKETDKKQKEADQKRLAKEKKDAQQKALKKKKEDQKAKEKALKEQQQQKAKEREELRKQKEAERKLRLEQQKKQVKK